MSRSGRPMEAFQAASWYAAISALAWWGWAANQHHGLADLVFFSNIFGIVTGVVFAALVVAELRGGAGRAGVVCRGACTVYGVVVAVVFATLLDGDLSSTGSLLLHAVVPALLVIDWLAAPRTARRLPGGVVAVWMVIPLLYIPVYTLGRRPGTTRPIYGFLDPESGDYWPLVCAFAAFFVVVAVVVWAAHRLRVRRTPEAVA